MLDSLYLGAVQLHDTTTASVVSVDGLTGLPGVRGAPSDRPEADGGVEAPNYYLPSRAITIAGELWDTTIGAAWGHWDSLAQVLYQAMNTDTLLKFQRSGGGLALQCYVRTAGDALPQLHDSQNYLEYLALLRAPDPLLYSQTLQQAVTSSPVSQSGFALPIVFPITFYTGGAAAGSVSVTNNGNVPTWPLLTITGPCSGPIIQNTSQSLYLSFPTLTLASTDTLIVTTAPYGRAATVSGSSVLGQLDYTNSRFFTISAGATETLQLYATSGATTSTNMTVAWRDAYLS